MMSDVGPVHLDFCLSGHLASRAYADSLGMPVLRSYTSSPHLGHLLTFYSSLLGVMAGTSDGS